MSKPDSHGASMAPPSFSVVIPVYGCVGCIDKLCARLFEVLTPITDQFEIILVDDRSPDNSWDAIVRLGEQYSEVKGIRLSRNFGQHIAISAGLAESKGDFAIVMDCDLQDPPEKIPDLIEKIKEGYDLVLARRVQRNHSPFRLIAAKLYFRLMSRLTEEDVDGSYGTFSIISRKVIDGFLQFGEKERHYLFILRWLGFRMGSIDYEHCERTIGKSSYSLKKLIQHAIDGLLFQATVLLRWIVTIGLLFSMLGIALAIFYIYQHFMYGSMPGWTSVVVLILICTGIMLSSLGVIGLYIGKIFDQTKSRPLYVIDVVADRSSQW